MEKRGNRDRYILNDLHKQFFYDFKSIDLISMRCDTLRIKIPTKLMLPRCNATMMQVTPALIQV